MKHQQQKYILSDQSNRTQLSLNLSKSQQKMNCKSIHEQIKERTLSKENSHRNNNQQQSQLSQRMKKQGTLNTIISNFFGASESKKQRNETSDNIEKSKLIAMKELKEQIISKDETIAYLTEQLKIKNQINQQCSKCQLYQENIQQITLQFSQQYELLLNSLKQLEKIGQCENQQIQVDQQQIIDNLNQQKFDLQQQVNSYEKQIQQLQKNEQELKLKIDVMQNPFQKYKNQLQQSEQLIKLKYNSCTNVENENDKNMNLCQPYLRARLNSERCN